MKPLHSKYWADAVDDNDDGDDDEYHDDDDYHDGDDYRDGDDDDMMTNDAIWCMHGYVVDYEATMHDEPS